MERAVTKPAGPAGRLPHLDGLRGIAALAVLLYHVHNLFGLTLGFERAYLLVDVFFMLSGFVLGLAWAADGGETRSARAILTARVGRLWPMIAAAAILGLVVHAALGDLGRLPLLLLLSLLCIPAAWQGGSLFPLNGPQWSLFWELAANVAHVLWLRRLGNRALAVVGLVMGIANIAAIQWRGADVFGPDGAFWWLTLWRIGWSYSIGLLVARSWRRAGTRPAVRWWQALAAFPLLVLALPWLPVPVATGDTLLVIVMFPLLFRLLVAARCPAAAGPCLERLGALSFPLYAVHLPLLTLFAALPGPRAICAAGAVAASAAMAVWLGRSAREAPRRAASAGQSRPIWSWRGGPSVRA